MRRNRIFLVGACALVALAACQRREAILPGERFDIDTAMAATLPEGESAGAAAPLRIDAPPAAAEGPRPIALPAMVSLSAWPQRGLSPAHVLPHVALSAAPAPVWTADIGAGNDRRHRMTADPVVEDGRVFTLDSEARVMAHSTGGAALWTTDLTPPGDRAGEASGGGLALAGGRLFVTTGFGTVSALDPATGGVIWTQEIAAVGTAAPAVVDGLLYVVGRDNRAMAIRTSDGKVVWSLSGPRAPAGYVGGPGPAVDGRIAVLPFSGGQVTAVLRQSGVGSWAALVGGQREGVAYAGVIRDIGADPVLTGGRVYVSNAAGRLAALDAGRGDRIWTAREGTMGTVLPVAGSLFMVTDANELVRLDAETGTRIWGTPLPNYVARRPRKAKAIHSHYGPILAGGRLLLASDDGLLRFFDPVSGALAGQVALPGGAAGNPVVVAGTLYLVNQRGQLVAFR